MHEVTTVGQVNHSKSTESDNGDGAPEVKETNKPDPSGRHADHKCTRRQDVVAK